jgi:hypothetical protein
MTWSSSSLYRRKEVWASVDSNESYEKCRSLNFASSSSKPSSVRKNDIGSVQAFEIPTRRTTSIIRPKLEWDIGMRSGVASFIEG